MSSPYLKRRRGRPRKVPNLPDYVGHESHTPSNPSLTLRYTPRHAPVCSCGTADASLCPLHGNHDNNSEVTLYDSPEFLPASSKKRKRSGYDGIQDNERAAKDTETPGNTSAPSMGMPPGQLTGPAISSAAPLTQACGENNTLDGHNNVSMGPLPPGRLVRPTIQTIVPGTAAQENFNRELGLWEAQVQQLRVAKNTHTQASLSNETDSLCEIDFFSAKLDVRKCIYRHLLVPSSRKIYFPSQGFTQTFSQMNRGFDPRILFVHPRIYNECRSILYGENIFVARRPEDLFLPTGIAGLRPTNAQRIKHIAIVRKGGAQECDVTSEVLANSLHQMVLQSPAFLSLQSVTIHFEVSRPADMNLFNLQMYLNSQGAHTDAQKLYKKKEMVKDAAGLVAFKAARKNSPFQGLFIKHDLEKVVTNVNTGRQTRVNVNQVRLFRTQGREVNNGPAATLLRQSIVDVLVKQKLQELPGADQRYNWFMKHHST